MPRPHFKREPCDCIDCTDPLRAATAADQASKHSAALQHPPPKCLVVFADGAVLSARGTKGATDAGTTLDDALCPHLDGVARDGCCGMLAVQSPTAGSRLAPNLDRLAQLFGLDADARGGPCQPPDLARRYKQLAAAFVSNDTEAVTLAAWAGFQRSTGLAQLVAGQSAAQPALSDLPTPVAVAAAVNEVLGLGNKQPADEGDDGALDMVMLHLDGGGTATAEPAAQAADARARLEWLDALVRRLNEQPGARNGLLLTLVLGSGGRELASAQPLLRPGGGGGDSLRPRQSFQLCRDEPVRVEERAPLLTAQRLPAVVRVDACRRLTLTGCFRQGGAGAILAERLLPELAYKLGRAPKYGA